MLKYLVLIGALILSFSQPALAKTIVVPANKGSAQAVFDSGAVKAGDTVLLEPGNHGALTLVGKVYNKQVTITSGQNGRAAFDQLALNRSARIRVRAVTVFPTKRLPKWAFAVTVRDSSHIVLDQLDVSTAKNTNGWSAGSWRTKIRSGITVSGQHITVSNSTIRNVQFGITSRADHAKIVNNSIELFSGDGIRGLGDNSEYRRNTIQTCVQVDENHDDGFQAWSIGPNGKVATGVIKNVVLDGNVILNGNHRLKCTLQGIGLFGGMYQNWTISNNTVVVDHWHGITVNGAIRVKVVGNTVVDSRPGNPGPPWVRIGPHRDGRASKQSQVIGNVTHLDAPRPDPVVTGVRRSRNKVVPSAEQALALRKR